MVISAVMKIPTGHAAIVRESVLAEKKFLPLAQFSKLGPQAQLPYLGSRYSGLPTLPKISAEGTLSTRP